MSNSLLDLFPLDATIAYLNHASFGAPATEMLSAAEAIRAGIERDTALGLDAGLLDSLRPVAEAIRPRLALSGGELAVVENSTEANNALARSWDLEAGCSVAMFDSEYSSVIRCWQVHAARQGARLHLLPLRLPTTREAILNAVSSLDPTVKVFLTSAISSTGAIAMPLPEISDICRRKGIDLIVDAAHVVGHMDSALDSVAPAAAFGSLHKWLPIPRSAGFLWVRDDLADAVKPPIVGITWDAPTLLERFSWPGTWNPTARLTVPGGFQLLDAFAREGHIAAAEALAERLSGALLAIGLIPTVEPSLAPPRLRSFLVPGITPQTLRDTLTAANVRAWTGPDPTGACVLRFSTNVYNTDDDATRLVDTAARALE
ncbi:MAG: aminotransferase class V-fold PLP-dependent enzyme [Micrococcales bacterium]|nr:aminotransferase class V-fold PLP-dependent enzyme [Micrococcales bacterium]